MTEPDAMTAVNARLKGLEARLEAMERRLDAEEEEGVTAQALQSIWAHLEERGLEGFPERIVSEMAAMAGRKPLTEGIDEIEERLTSLEAKLGTTSGAGSAASASGSESAESGRIRSGSYGRRFLALARQVKSLKATVSTLEEEAAALRADAGVEVLKVLRSEEFKELFNAKMQGVLALLKTEIVPRAIDKALETVDGTEAAAE